MDARASKYPEIYARALRDPEGFWGEAAKDIDETNWPEARSVCPFQATPTLTCPPALHNPATVVALFCIRRNTLEGIVIAPLNGPISI